MFLYYEYFYVNPRRALPQPLVGPDSRRAAQTARKSLRHALAHAGLSRESLRRTLGALIDGGLVGRNPGYGHPLRPEYVLTRAGERIAGACRPLVEQLRRGNLEDVGLKKWSMPVVFALAEKAPAILRAPRAARRSLATRPCPGAEGPRGSGPRRPASDRGLSAGDDVPPHEAGASPGASSRSDPRFVHQVMTSTAIRPAWTEGSDSASRSRSSSELQRRGSGKEASEPMGGTAITGKTERSTQGSPPFS